MIQIPALSALSIGQKVAGVAITLVLWLAPAGAVWLHMHGKLSAQFELGKAACESENAAAVLEAQRTAMKEWRATQGAVLADAKRDAAQIDKSLTTGLARLDSIITEYSDYAIAHPLPADCRADSQRVRRVNEARR